MFNSRSFSLGAVCSAVVCLGGAVVLSQPAKNEPPAKKPGDKPQQVAKPAMPEGMDPAKMMAEYMKTMNPGDHHKALEPLIGNWKTTSKTYFMGPDGPSSESHGNAKRTWALGGRFVHEQFDGELNMPGADGKMTPMPFQGAGMVGYNNSRNIYEGVWADTMGTQMLTFSGCASQDNKTFTYYGTMDEPDLHITGRFVKYVTKIIDNDHHTFTMYDLAAGDNYKAMEVAYERVK